MDKTWFACHFLLFSRVVYPICSLVASVLCKGPSFALSFSVKYCYAYIFARNYLRSLVRMKCNLIKLATWVVRYISSYVIEMDAYFGTLKIIIT